MKSLADLQAIREKMQRQMDLRDADGDQIRVVVGMATCGIAAGARPVLTAFLEEIEKRDLKNITVAQTGCIGVCRLEPIVEVYVPGQEKVTYVKMSPDKVMFSALGTGSTVPCCASTAHRFCTTSTAAAWVQWMPVSTNTG